MTDRQVVVGVAVVDAGRVLAALRPGPDGGWEFPGGKVEPGETDRDAAVRELDEELGLRVTVGASLGLDQPIGDKYVLRVYLAELMSGTPVLREHTETRWVSVARLSELDWLPADRPFVPLLRATLRGGG
ncbi:8-oxo-dGTP diphosphatase [Kribbella amoyensis]|uniref:8-oxo-dGTP diphosphatase n=1 Tax=Kribbella amoyensis TaxID=996641 RepID=A0A561B3C8_9ACTN|nr:(deoxy)nucleoside triphosphate pyrophosphohydrolase [Kribbella amoyensis]TWD73312.1 8-oxo-dGTP diphosphatase [Kribbella amoyensis]